MMQKLATRLCGLLSAALVIVSCGDDAPVGNQGPLGSAAVDAGGVAGSGGGGIVKLGPCVAPRGLPAAPLQWVASVNCQGHALGPQKAVHIIDIEFDPDTSRIYGCGAGGLFVFEHSGGTIELVGSTAAGMTKGSKYDRIEVLGGGMIALTSRKGTLSFYDVSKPPAVTQLSQLSIADASGMGRKDDLLYVLGHDGALSVVDISSLKSPKLVGKMSGLNAPWDMRVVGDRAYVADTILGLVVIDLAKPAEPKLLETIATLGGAQDLWVEGDLLYVAVGGEGIEIFSLKEPDTPKSLSSVSWDSAVVSVSASGSLVWGVNHESIVAMDASDPNNPVPIATMKTPKWALHVFAKGNIAYVADWTHANVYFLDRSVNAPSSEVSPGTLYFTSGAKEATLNVANRGVAPLQFSGLTVTDPRYSTELSTMEVAPGQSAQVKVKLGAGKEAIDSEPLTVA